MCGIVGYIGGSPAKEILLNGLHALEYRGYDSTGIALIESDGLWVAKRAGKLNELVQEVAEERLKGCVGIGHSRWATHGRPSDENSHPHLDCTRTLAVIHNGIIENFSSLKEQLMSEGHEFRSETDTEVLSHLFEKHYRGDLAAAVRAGLRDVRGAFAIAVLSQSSPDEIVAAKTSSPLVIGLGQGENFLASDVPALLPHTRQMLFLSDGEMAVIRRDGVEISDLEGHRIQRESTRIDWDPVTAQKQGYKHFMLKEIFEQPQAVADTLTGRFGDRPGEVLLRELPLSAERLKSLKNIYLVACGTSWHAGLVAKYLYQRFLKLPIGVELASEFRYSEPYVSDRTLVIAISQSGETIDTLAAIRQAKKQGATIISIVNVVGSQMTRDSDGVIYTHAGPEIAVASTKATTAQLAALALLGVYLGRQRGELSVKEAEEQLQALRQAPTLIEKVLSRASEVETLAQRFYDKSDFLFFGRDILCPIAYEGALKLKEISYIHAEAYAAGEMKHGPIALIDEKMPVVILVSKNSVYDKVFSNIQEVKARKGIVIALTDERTAALEGVADHIVELPTSPQPLTPLIFVVPLQLLAYYVGVLRGTDVDQPRNLAKSVTVE
jgi:glucosamine--fructose-6-phosphate aminotransferase (isomerizing)